MKKDALELLERITLAEKRFSLSEDRYKVYKSWLENFRFFPDENTCSSEIFQNVIDSYDNWFSKVEYNEYFRKSWNALFDFILADEGLDFPVGEKWLLEKIFYKIQQIYGKPSSEKITTEEQIFIGNFMTCFPNHEDIKVLALANHFIANFQLYIMIFCSSDNKNISVLEMIQMVTFWKERLALESQHKLERVK